MLELAPFFLMRSEFKDHLQFAAARGAFILENLGPCSLGRAGDGHDHGRSCRTASERL